MKYNLFRAPALALLQPIGMGIGAAASFLIVVLALRDQQFESLAAYGAGVAVAAMVSALIGGGTTLAFTTGEVDRQRAVRGVRNRLVVPAVAASSVIAAAAYGLTTQLSFWALIAGGAATLANVASELDASYMRRKLRTVGLFFADVLSRFAGLYLVFVGAEYAYAMLACAIIRCTFLFALSCDDPSRKRRKRFTWMEARRAYEVKLTGLSIAYIFCDRVGAAIVPVMAPPPVAGGYVAVVGMQQNISGVLMSGIQTILAVRSEGRIDLKWTGSIEKIIMVLAAVTSAILVVGSDTFMKILGLSVQSVPNHYWNQLVVLLPLALMSRTLDFRAIAAARQYIAVASRIAATMCVLVGASLSLALHSVAVLGWSLVVAELVAILTWAVTWKMDSLRKDSVE